MQSSPKPTCRLSSLEDREDDFAVIRAVSKTLKRAGLPEQAREFVPRALATDSYDALLQVCLEYVEVE